MMGIERYVFAVALAMVYASGQAQVASGAYAVTGSVGSHEFDGKTVYIDPYNGRTPLDSAVVTDGRVVFRGQTDVARYCRVDVGDNVYASFILEPGNIVIDFDSLRCGRGTALNDMAFQMELEDEAKDSVVRKIWDDVEATVADEAGRENVAVRRVKDYYHKVFRKYFAGHEDDALGYLLLNSGFWANMRLGDKAAVLAELGPGCGQRLWRGGRYGRWKSATVCSLRAGRLGRATCSRTLKAKAWTAARSLLATT